MITKVLLALLPLSAAVSLATPATTTIYDLAPSYIDASCQVSIDITPTGPTTGGCVFKILAPDGSALVTTNGTCTINLVDDVEVFTVYDDFAQPISNHLIGTNSLPGLTSGDPSYLVIPPDTGWPTAANPVEIDCGVTKKITIVKTIRVSWSTPQFTALALNKPSSS